MSLFAEAFRPLLPAHRHPAPAPTPTPTPPKDTTSTRPCIQSQGCGESLSLDRASGCWRCGKCRGVFWGLDKPEPPAAILEQRSQRRSHRACRCDNEIATGQMWWFALAVYCVFLLVILSRK